MTLDSLPIAKRIVQNGRSGVVSGRLRALGSPRIDDRRPPRGTGRAGGGLLGRARRGPPDHPSLFRRRLTDGGGGGETVAWV